MKNPILASCVSLFALAFCATAFAKGPEKGEAYLVRTTPASDPDAKGRIQTSQSKNDEEIRFDAEKLNPSGSFEVFMEDAVGSAVFVSFGTMSHDGKPGHFKLRVREKDGPLPLSATSVDDYADRAVEVRAGGTTTVLVGIVPLTEKKHGKQGFTKAKADLALPASPPDANAKGRDELWEKIKDGRSRFRVKAEKLSKSETYRVFVEDAVGSAVFVQVGDMTKSGGKGEHSEFKLYTDSKNGDPLPAGAKVVADLADRAVQIRNSGNAIVLEGVLPAIQ